jgi:diguanylate cyclase (GGDEF)-like protein
MEIPVEIPQNKSSYTTPLLATAWSRSHDGFMIFDQAEHVVQASGGLRDVLGLPADVQLVGKVRDLLAMSLELGEAALPDLGRWLDQSDMQLSGKEGEASVLLTTGASRTLHGNLATIGDGYRVATFKDVTATLEAEGRMVEMASRDALTGIGNRRFFAFKLDAAMARLAASDTGHAAVMFLDLDRFKIINDTLGHAAGDQLLRLVAERLQSLMGAGDVLARMGGDEFAVLLPHSPATEVVAALAKKIIDLIQRTYLVDGQVMNVGVSIGIAVAPMDAGSSDQLLKNADLALYHSKSEGRGVFHFFEPAMAEKAQQRRALELDLRRALVLRQFELHYQPQIDVESHAITGMAGLLRWRHPQRGIMLPEEFMGLAEEIGLGASTADWVLKTACREAARWPEHVSVAVKVSGLQFEMATFVASVERSLGAAKLCATRLEIEVTEEVLQRNGPTVLATLNTLRSLGVRVVMDNFGVGLASLSQLVNFPFDKIKIDESLLSGGADDNKSRAIVRAVSALGESLGISTLASGVETAEHLARVRMGGCSSVQGVYSSEICSASEVAGLFSDVSAGGIHVGPQSVIPQLTA